MTVARSQQLSDACQWDGLLAVQVAGKRLQPRTILGRLGHVGRKRALHTRATARALLYLRLMPSPSRYGSNETISSSLIRKLFLFPLK